MVKDFGSYLKHERELRGVPLEEISGATKIHIRFLKALEENSFEKLPGEVFIKGYIRSYANIIGSDVDEMLNIYKESVELNRQENAPPKTPETQFKTTLIYGLLTLAVVGLLFGVGILIKNGVGVSSEKNEPIASQQKPAERVMSEPIKSSATLEKIIAEENMSLQEEGLAEPEIFEPEASEQEPTVLVNSSDQEVKKEDADEKKILLPPESMAPIVETPVKKLTATDSPVSIDTEKPLKLTIRANESSWFNMTIDDFREEDFILPTGTAKTFWGNEVFRLTIGNKTGVELFLNGKALTLPESKDRVVKDFIINSKLVVNRG